MRNITEKPDQTGKELFISNYNFKNIYKNEQMQLFDY